MESSQSQGACSDSSLRYYEGRNYWESNAEDSAFSILTWQEGDSCQIRLVRDHALSTLFSNPADLTAALGKLVDSSQGKLRPPVQSLSSAAPIQSESYALGLKTPLQLLPLQIPKPWGHEVWYSGVEKRGVCKAHCLDGLELEIPFVELALGRADPEEQCSFILLKELVPFALPFYGELYTELHEKKSEVYVVSGVDLDLCKDGQGSVKLGMLPNTQPSQLQEFKEALLNYESVRKQVDGKLATTGHRFPTSQSESEVRLLAETKQKIAPKLCQEENEAYRKASSFLQKFSISLGDIVRVPTHTPHALQPGVRVIEFQTPVYERKVLSSNQKLLTQDHCDIESGVPLIKTDLAQNAILRARTDRKPAFGFEEQEVVQFEEFRVYKLSWNLNSKDQTDLAPLAAAMQQAELCFILSGSVDFGPEQTAVESTSWILPNGVIAKPSTLTGSILFGTRV